MGVAAFDLVGIIGYFAFVGIFAYLTRRTRTFSEFSLGGQKVPAVMIFSSLAATYIGPGYSVGFTAKAFTTGFAFWILALTYGFQTVLMGIYFAPRLAKNHRDCHTIGDVMAKHYGKFAQILTGIVSVGLCIGFTAVMGKIGGILLQEITGWHLSISIAIVTLFTAVYTFTGGLRAVVATEGLQFSLFSIIVPVMLVVAFLKSPGNAADLSGIASRLTSAGLSDLTGMQMLGIAISFLLGETLIPPYTNRALAAKTSEATRKGFIAAGIYAFIWLAIVACLGVVAHQYMPSDTNPDSVFIQMGKLLLPAGVFGLLLAALIAIVMSSQESVLNAGTVAVVRDIISVNRPLSDKLSLIIGRLGTILIAIIAVIVAGFSPSIIDGLLICYSVWAPSVLLPFLLALYLKKTSSLAGWLSIIMGAGTSILWQTILKEPAGVPAILVGLALSAAAYGFGHIFGQKNYPVSLGGVQ